MPQPLTLEGRIARARFRAWHRGTRESDYLIGGFFDRFHREWQEAEIAWFEALLEEQDADVLAWATGIALPPHYLAGPLMDALCRADFVRPAD